MQSIDCKHCTVEQGKFHFKVSVCNLSEIVYIVEETGWPTGQGVLAATCTTVFIVGHLNKQFINDTIYFFFVSEAGQCASEIMLSVLQENAQ